MVLSIKLCRNKKEKKFFHIWKLKCLNDFIFHWIIHSKPLHSEWSQYTTSRLRKYMCTIQHSSLWFRIYIAIGTLLSIHIYAYKIIPRFQPQSIIHDEKLKINYARTSPLFYVNVLRFFFCNFHSFNLCHINQSMNTWNEKKKKKINMKNWLCTNVSHRTFNEFISNAKGKSFEWIKCSLNGYQFTWSEFISNAIHYSLKYLVQFLFSIK